MRKRQATFECRKSLLLILAGVLIHVLPAVFGLAHAMTGNAQQQSRPQTAPAAAPVFEYEVASIKPSKPGAVGGGIKNLPGPGPVSDTFSARNLLLTASIQIAYGIPPGAEDGRLVGAPDWLNSERYDIEAKMDPAVVEALQKLSVDARVAAQRQMLQALLADRLKLVIHRETKEAQVYSLVIAKNGPKLQESKPNDADPRLTSQGRGGSLSLTGQEVPIVLLVTALTRLLNRPVFDKTGLTGTYDFTLTWTPDDSQAQTPPGVTANGQPPPPDSNGPTIFTAIQDQLGLKLESGKRPVEIIVIDHVERPSGN
jgi:uncharacterized protein (TIGR03435 family)